MKYEVEIELNLPRNKVIELFDSTENLYKWQPELISFTHQSGSPGQVGAKSKLRYKMGRREIDMIETITLRELPNRFDGTYEAKGVYNIVKNQFIDNGNSTLWKVEQEFQFSGFMAIMSLFMRGAFKKQSMLYLTRFKAFAEGEEVK